MIVFLICKYIYFNTSTIVHLHRTADEPAVRLPRRPRPRHSQSGSTPARRPFAIPPLPAASRPLASTPEAAPRPFALPSAMRRRPAYLAGRAHAGACHGRLRIAVSGGVVARRGGLRAGLARELDSPPPSPRGVGADLVVGVVRSAGFDLVVASGRPPLPTRSLAVGGARRRRRRNGHGRTASRVVAVRVVAVDDGDRLCSPHSDETRNN